MIDNPYLILMRSVTALYLMNKTSGTWEDGKKIIKESLTYIDIPLTTFGEDSIARAGTNMRSMVEWMLASDQGLEFDRDDILSRIRMNLKDDPGYIQEIEMAIDVANDEDRCRKRIRSILSELRFEVEKQRIKRYISKLNHQINFSESPGDHKQAIRELKDKLDRFNVDTEHQEKVGFIGRLMTTDTTDMSEIFKQAKELVSAEGVLQTGLVGLNRLLGIGGFRRGELVNFGALTHHYKSGILNDLARHLPLYNTPFMLDKTGTKKPLIIRISFENKLEQDLPIIYRALIEQDTGEKISLDQIDPDRAAEYVKTRMGVNGYEFAMECYDPNDFDIYDLFDVISYYEAAGYEIHAILCDYLDLIVKHTGDRKDESINEYFQMVRNHCHPKGITFITAHQLSPDAVKLARESAVNFVEKVAHGSYYRNTTSLSQKLDCEIILYIYKAGERSFLMFARGKHRGGETTPIKYRVFSYEFQSVGGICDDIHKEVPDCIYELNKYIQDSYTDGGVDSPLMDEDAVAEAW